MKEKLQNDLLIRTARGEKTERPPVWLLRQAGRILPEYRAVRNSLSGFKELVETPERAAEVTIQPVDILGVDAAIIFSDILVIPEAMGLPYEMVEKKGPHFPETIRSAADIDRLRVARADDLDYTIRAIEVTKQNLKGRVPVIGFAGAPWTIFAYMIEGGGSKTFSKARRLLYTDPGLSHRLLEKITESTINYLKGQIGAGADIVQIFDSWAGMLPPDHYREFAVRYIDRICEAIDEVPKTVFAKGAYFALEDFSNTSCQVVGTDWNMNLTEVRRVVGDDRVLQGNLDPCVLYGTEEQIEREVKKMLSHFQNGKNIANLGHGVYPDTDWKKVKFFVDYIRQYKY